MSQIKFDNFLGVKPKSFEFYLAKSQNVPRLVGFGTGRVPDVHLPALLGVWAKRKELSISGMERRAVMEENQ